MIRALVIIATFSSLTIPAFTQDSISKRITFSALKELNYVIKNDSSIVQITALKFYISNICFKHKDSSIYKVPNSFYLIDGLKLTDIELKIPFHYKESIVEFCIGIDSATNYEGALSGALDPSLGMYWTWQSGYINIKIEGVCSSCETRNNEFTFHLGGFQHPYNSLQKKEFKYRKNKNTLVLTFDINQWINQSDSFDDCTIMSPSSKAQNYAFLFSTFLKANND